MTKLIDKDALVAEIERLKEENKPTSKPICDYIKGGIYGFDLALEKTLSILDTLEVKEVDLMIHTIIAECCNWLAVHTELNHEQIEDCRNLMLTVKDEQLKAKQG